MFTLNEEQITKIDDWTKTLNPPIGAYCGAIGGRFTYQFTPTSLGTVVKVIDNLSKEFLDLSDYDQW